ncbi:MAG TPA: glycogen debranching protein GlgX [Alphaproteobacteria bacterium]|nr:glycogen debranching protein GlgX [Alphaproteobacteria bacterium]
MLVSTPDRLEPGSPYPLGSTWDGLGVNFAVFSAHARRIELCVFDPSGRHEIARYELPEWTNEIWHGYLPDAQPGLLYGYRVHGDYAPERGHRFNHHKLLIDPYAKKIAGQIHWTNALFGYRVGAARTDLTVDRRDSAPAMPKSVVTEDHFSWGQHPRPHTPWPDTVIYEAHVKGLTQLFDAVRPPERGTFAALSHPKVTDHLKRMGVTAIELLPVHAYLQDRLLLEKGLSNYWGYNTLSFFAPEPRYLSTGDLNELRIAVRRLHAAGLEVILDVVYNHTCEGSELGPTLSWRGFDNACYYRLQDANARYLVNDTGTGNTLNLSHPRVLQMVADSLRYWTQSFGIDGFRFDLGVTLGREPYGFDPGSGFFDVLRQDPVLSQVKLISEPWDIGPGGYQLGKHPPGFAEWNDQYRDSVRRFWKSDDAQRRSLASRLSGSGDLFDHAARRPWASVNYIASHDGQTLHDLVSYEGKHNDANGEDNRDGHSDNHARNWGAEGPTEHAGTNDQRERVKRAMLMTVLMSLGTPMLMAGDEFGRTQKGNNNAYCQDNDISWVDWSLLETSPGAELADFVRRLAEFRRNHRIVRSGAYLYGQQELAPGLHDIDWFDERGHVLVDEDWDNPAGRALIMRRAVRVEDDGIEVVAFLVNGSEETLLFQLPGDYAWRVAIDSARQELNDEPVNGTQYTVEHNSAAVLIAHIAPERA